MLDGSNYDVVSAGGGVTATTYPFSCDQFRGNSFEGARKSAKLAWVKQLAEDLGFPVVVQRQGDKYVYVEIGDPDAPR